MGARQNGELVLNGYRVLVWEMETFWRWVVTVPNDESVLNVTELCT